MSRKFLDPDDPFFAHAWRRWATVLFPLIWAVIEVALGNIWWALGIGGIAAYAFFMLIVKGPTQR
jgi:hypothetical protein